MTILMWLHQWSVRGGAMRKWVILASVGILAMSSVSCADSRDGSITAPSGVSGDAGTSARGGRVTGGGTLSLVMYVDNNHDGLPNWNDTVTFNVSATGTDTPTVNLVCSQKRVAVYGATGGFYASYPWPWTQYMRLYSASWGGGAASCTATLTPVSGSPVLASLSFTAGE